MLQKLAQFRRALLTWYAQSQRTLPWRRDKYSTAVADLNPYFVLVSETMLQQTQVVTVIPYFNRFIERFPTVAALAESDLQDVLRLWQGLGYYSRARNLQAAAKMIVTDFAGQIPSKVDDLLKLPGVGRYTAGAIASLAFEKRAPILDGNVTRVICRLDCVQSDPRDPVVRTALWNRAEEILPREKIGDFNSGLMELGALICTPRSPQCLICPVRSFCQAAAAGLQNEIPKPKKQRATPQEHRQTFVIQSGDKYLIEQRPANGRWASMWQFVTIEKVTESVSPQLLLSNYQIKTSTPKKFTQVQHALTHRKYFFDVYRCETKDQKVIDSTRWATIAELDQFPLPKPHVKVLELIRKSQI